jgi:thymidylate synthase ThyX
MPYEAKIILDSVSIGGSRLTTFEISYPRFVHAELMTHRVFSRNAASSRAIPVAKMLKRVEDDPAMPVWFGKNEPGMKAKEEVDEDVKKKVIEEWLGARDQMVKVVKSLNELGLHKQIANRLLEPWMFITVIVSATEWENFFKLRCHPDAQPEIRHIAEMMKKIYDESKPQLCAYGTWHIPMVTDEERKELTLTSLLKIATARCARISYLTHDGKRDYAKDEELHDSLASSGHWSPFEHVAFACREDLYTPSNFVGWEQYRKSFKEESGKSPKEEPQARKLEGKEPCPFYL